MAQNVCYIQIHTCKCVLYFDPVEPLVIVYFCYRALTYFWWTSYYREKYTKPPPKGYARIAEFSDCGHRGWLGATPSVDACATKCRRSDPNAQRFVWVAHNDMNCKCASSTCSLTSDNVWHKMCDTYEYTNGGDASGDLQTDASDAQEVMPA